MVRGSDSESGDKESKTYSLYEGTLKRWPAGRLKLKAELYKEGLWDVVERGPSAVQGSWDMVERGPFAVQASPVSITPGDQSTTPQEWYYVGRDNEVQGPCSAEEIARVFDRISQTERLEGESVYVHHKDNTAGEWAPWSESVAQKVHMQWSLESNLRKLRTPQFPFGGADPAVRMLSFGGGTGGGAMLASPTPSVRDRESGQQRPCTAENDRAAFYNIMRGIDCSDGSIGESLLLTAGDKFKDDESGHKLFAWLEKRAGCGSIQGGLVDADDLKRQLEEYKFCEGKVITVEELALASEQFERMWLRQPMERQGIRGDMFDKWVSKLPKAPFHSELLPIIKGMNVVKNGSVYADYSQCNESLRAIYADYLKTHPPVKGIGAAKESDTAYERDHAAALIGGPFRLPHGGFYCFRCWQKDDHLSMQCGSAPGVCTACGMDSGKARLSCGGEQDPKKCIIKGYRPNTGLPAVYIARLKEWGANNNVNFVDSGVAAPARALSSLVAPPPSTVGPSASVAGGYQGGAQMALAASAGFDPNNIEWQISNGMWTSRPRQAPG